MSYPCHIDLCCVFWRGVLFLKMITETKITMKISKPLFALLFALGVNNVYTQNNVGIGTNTPNASSVLDVTSTNKGLLIPRLALIQTTNPSPVTAPATSLLVYNSATVNDVVPGFYYWNGTMWVTVGGAATPSCTTLDQAYDCGGPGVGKLITADSGPVTINKNANSATNNHGLYTTVNVGTSANPSSGVYVEHSGQQGVAIFGEITNAANLYSAIQGVSSSNQTNTSGISGVFDGAAAGYGVYGTNTSATAGSQAIFGFNQRVTGGWGVEGAGVNGVYGRTNNNTAFGVVGYNFGASGGLDVGIGVMGNGSTGVQGETSNGEGYGVYGKNISNSSSDNNIGVGGYGWVGVYGLPQDATGFGVYSDGNFGASGTKSFVIDHPLDPENKILKHFSAESPEVLNIYRGNVLLDANGNATVILPEYFESININFSYQLTAIGAPAKDIYVAEEVKGNAFKISGGNSNQKISWVVYAERNDKYIQTYPVVKEVEVEKRTKGKYIRPELYGKSRAFSLFSNTDEPKILPLKK